MPAKEASSEETPYGRYITSDGWFVLNLADALAVRNEEKGGATYPLESREHPFRDVGVRVCVLSPGEPNALYHSEGVQEGFLVLSGECILIVEEEERPLREWDYFHCPAGTHHIMVGAGDEPCAILMIGARPEVETLHYPMSEVASKYGASAAKDTDEPDEAYADWPGDYRQSVFRGRLIPTEAVFRSEGHRPLRAFTLPGISDRPEQLEEVVPEARAAGACGIWANLLFLRPGTREHFLEALADGFPDQPARYERLYARRAYLGAEHAKPIRSQVAELARKHGVRDRRRAPILPEPEPEQLALAI